MSTTCAPGERRQSDSGGVPCMMRSVGGSTGKGSPFRKGKWPTTRVQAPRPSPETGRSVTTRSRYMSRLTSRSISTRGSSLTDSTL